MKSFSLKKDSWHWRLASTYGPESDWDVTINTTICSYFWSVLMGACAAIGLTIGAGLLAGYVLGQTVAWIVCMFLGLGFMPQADAFGVITFLIIAMLLLLIVGILLGIKYDNKRKVAKAGQPEKEPGFIGQAYNSFKNKTCHKITLS